MTADHYRQIVPGENSLGLHYASLANVSLTKSANYTAKHLKTDRESAKSG
jgi:hypothetical protein